MERYLGGEEIDQSVLIDDLEKAVARGSFFPVIPVCSTTGVGTLELLEIITSGFPSPPEHQLPEVFTPQGKSRNSLPCDPSGPLLAEVVKTTSDPYVGRVSLVRVFSGTISPDATVHVSGHFSSFFGLRSRFPAASGSMAGHADHGWTAGHADHDEDERIGTLSFPLGKQQRPGAVGGGRRHLCHRTAVPSRDRRHAVGRSPTRWCSSRGRCPSRCCRSRSWGPREGRRGQATVRHSSGSPPRTRPFASSTRPRRSSSSCGAWAKRTPTSCSTGCFQPVRRGQVDQVDVGVPLRETICGSGQGEGPPRQAERWTRPVRRVRHRGGAPAPEGTGFEFIDKVVGGAVPRQFIPSVEKGVRAQLEKGLKRATRWSTSG